MEKECKQLDAAIVQLEEDEKNIIEGDQLSRRNENLDHRHKVKEIKDCICVAKIELDKALANR